MYRKRWSGGVRVGVAYNAYVPQFVASYPSAADYVEVPFELLRHDPSVINLVRKPIVLHCASMSIAGAVPAAPATVDEIHEWSERTETPWIGEHLSYITADPTLAGDHAEPYAPGEAYNIGYTVSPPMNPAAVESVCRAVQRYGRSFPVPLLLENAPIYFTAPGTTMSQVNFVTAICEQCSVMLLLDLAHFYITSKTLDFDPFEAVKQYPLDRVVEAHVSGVSEEGEAHWDNHAGLAPEPVHRLLETVVGRAPQLQAVTLEYNWSSRFPQKLLAMEIDRVRATIASARRE